MSSRGLVARNVALAVCSVLVSLIGLSVVGEVATCHREWNLGRPPGTTPFLYYRSVRLRHALVRNYSYFGYASINGSGFRGAKETPRQPPAGVVRIMAVGASTTFDVGAGVDSLAWPARLESKLNAASPGTRVEVINAGVGGYYVLDNLIRLQTELHTYRPAAIILYHAHNDLFLALGRPTSTVEFTATPDAIEPVTPWGHWLGRNSLFYAKVVERVGIRYRASRQRRRTVSRTESIDWSRVLDDGASEFERNLASFVLIAREHGIVVIIPEVVHRDGVSAHPSEPVTVWTSAIGTTPADVALDGYQRFNERGRRVAERLGAIRIPMGAHGMAGDSLYAPDDPIHFNRAGADRFATKLAAEFQDRGIVPLLAQRAPVSVAVLRP